MWTHETGHWPRGMILGETRAEPPGFLLLLSTTLAFSQPNFTTQSGL